MGGWASGLAEGVKSLAEPLADSAKEAFEHSAALSHTMNLHPESKALADSFLTDYVKTQRQQLGISLQAEDRIKGFNTNTRNPAGQRIHPQTGQVLSDAPVDSGKLHSEANAVAREKWLGPKDIYGVLAANAIHKQYGLAAAQNFSDNIAFLLKDNEAGISSFKRRVQTSLKKNAPVGQAPYMNIRSDYVPQTDIERAMHGYVYSTFSPLLVIPHTITFFNGLFGTTPGNFIKGTVESLHGGLGKNSDYWNPLVNTGVMTESLMREADLYNKFSSSDRKFKVPNESILARTYKMFHQPGFASLRDQNLISGAIVGKMTAEQIAKDFYFDPSNPTLLWNLKEFGLDPSKIHAQGGQLDSQDIDTAIFKFVDQHYFLDSTLQRSRVLQSTPIGRTLGMYHGYVTRQAKLMSRAMFKDLKTRGPASVIRNLAIGGILFPMLGEGVKLLELGIRGQDAGKEAGEDISNLELENGPGAALGSYIDSISHVGAIGVYSDLMRGALHHALVDRLAGPVIGSGAELTEDLISALQRDYKSNLHHPGKDWSPVGRDVMYDTPGVSLAARLGVHRFLPKKGEHPEHDPLRELYDYIRNESSSDNSTTSSNNQPQ